MLSHEHDDHSYLEGVSDYKLLIETPGEYEVSGTFIYGVKTYHDENRGKDRGDNTIFQIIIDGFSLLHLGDLGHELATETLEKLTDVDVLMVPVGGVYTIDSKTAVKVISSLEPGIIIPMHYQTDDLTGLKEKLDDIKVFMDEIGVEDNGFKKVEKLTLRSKSDIPDESEVYILSPQH
jgi:L-ascorbate metabolism protein UlaG (beta-lactamase superfamily)